MIFECMNPIWFLLLQASTEKQRFKSIVAIQKSQHSQKRKAICCKLLLQNYFKRNNGEDLGEKEIRSAA